MPWLLGAGVRYLVTVPGMRKAYYTEEPNEDKAIQSVVMRQEVQDKVKGREENPHLYIHRMQKSCQIKPWPLPLPELESHVAIQLMRDAMTHYKSKSGESYDIDWAALDRAISERGISSYDADSLKRFLENLAGPAQLELPGLEQKAFTKDADKDNPGAAAAANWKVTHKMEFVTIDKIKAIVGENPIDISVKLDGELVALCLQGGQAQTVTTKGTIRADMPPTEEASKLLSGHEGGIFVGELYVVNQDEAPVSYMKAASVLRDPELEQDHLIRLSVFDVIQLDGKDYAGESLETRVKLINEIFGKGKAIHPAYYVLKSDADQAEDLWDQIPDKGWEGLIVYMGTQIFKVKPIMSYDMVVVAVERSPKYVDRIGAALCSFIDKDSRFRLNGAVGGGFTDTEKVELLDWAERNKVWEDEERIWVDPFKEPLVVEVEAMEVNVKDRPKLEFKDHKWVQIEEDMSGVLRFPHFKRFREDKSPKYNDTPLEQLPLHASSAMVPGKHLQVITGQTGIIQQLVPKSGDSGFDYDIIVKWDSPLWGELDVTEVHPTEVVTVW